jgi:hypothetical protein
MIEPSIAEILEATTERCRNLDAPWFAAPTLADLALNALRCA